MHQSISQSVNQSINHFINILAAQGRITVKYSNCSKGQKTTTTTNKQTNKAETNNMYV